MMERYSIPLVALRLLAIGMSLVGADTINISIPNNAKTRILLPDVVGYSIEPIWVDSFIRTRKTSTLLNIIANITGKPVPIRVGGNTADQTYQHATLSTGNVSVTLPDHRRANMFNITPDWYQTWGDYFPRGTDLIYTLNFADSSSAWANAVKQAEFAYTGLGDKLKQFELGNEVDHFVSEGWRRPYPAWGVEVYIKQYRNLTTQIINSPWYKRLPRPPTFQAGVIADPPLVPDQKVETGDFSIVNLTANGAGGLLANPEDKARVSSLSVHLYPQSTCDAPRWHRMRLDLLSNHTALWLNVSQYLPQIAAADRAGIPLVMGETNSVSCGGRSGISDTLGAALWAVDYVLLGASLGLQKIFFHLGAQSEYSAFTPEPYFYKNERLTSGVRSTWYSHYFIAKTVATTYNKTLRIAALPDANSSSLAGYGIYAGPMLEKLVFLDMGVWNGTEGLSNPSTINVTDAKSFSSGIRPNNVLNISTIWKSGQSVTVTRLTGPGTNAKSEILVSGVKFDMEIGSKVGNETVETLVVGKDGQLNVPLTRAEGILLEVKTHVIES
jgi:Glycosyl hydrolase family 79 C-terminal beta domain